MKRYLCPAGDSGLSMWRSEEFGYIIQSRLGGGGFDSPVFSVRLPVIVAEDDFSTMGYIAESFINSMCKDLECHLRMTSLDESGQVVIQWSPRVSRHLLHWVK